jgi:biopolymer transport protein ExbD
MKRKRLVTKLGVSEFDEPRGAVAPLIDVCFLLLIFFLVTTTIQKRERDLTMHVGGGPRTNESHPLLPVVVEVRAGGEIALNPGVGETTVSMDPDDRELTVLAEHLEAMQAVQGERDIVVQLRANDEARQQRVVDVLNCFAAVGVTTVGLVE